MHLAFGFPQVFEGALAHERIVTGRLNDLVDLALEERDHASQSFLRWFVDEQVEENATATQTERYFSNNPIPYRAGYPVLLIAARRLVPVRSLACLLHKKRLHSSTNLISDCTKLAGDLLLGSGSLCRIVDGPVDTSGSGRQNGTALVRVAADGDYDIRIGEHLVGHLGRLLIRDVDAVLGHCGYCTGVFAVCLESRRSDSDSVTAEVAGVPLRHLRSAGVSSAKIQNAWPCHLSSHLPGGLGSIEASRRRASMISSDSASARPTISSTSRAHWGRSGLMR